MKRRIVDYLVWIGIAACCCFLSLALAWPALAQEITTGTGILCDTQDQLKQYAQEQSFEKVNAEKAVCGVAPVAFVIGQKHGQVRTKDGPYEITEIIVVGFQTPMGWMRVPPNVQFTLFRVKEEDS